MVGVGHYFGPAKSDTLSPTVSRIFRLTQINFDTYIFLLTHYCLSAIRFWDFFV